VVIFGWKFCVVVVVWVCAMVLCVVSVVRSSLLVMLGFGWLLFLVVGFGGGFLLDMGDFVGYDVDFCIL